MSEPNKAVFLSYASQDAAAAKRICEALRAGGVEVWFDQSELRGGDAWDQKIRGQIRECALFIPVISANTSSRHEGYFRLEWNLADERTQKMARNRPFIVPVCLDATPDGGADVPDSFTRVQWTRLPAGETSPAFVTRIAGLLSPPTASAAQSPVPSESAAADRSAAPRSVRPVLLIASFAAALCVGYLALDKWLVAKRESDHASGSSVLTSPMADAPSVDEKSIAVLPFVDMSEKKDQEYFSDGLAEELLDLLAKTPGLHVIARTSSFSFKGKSDDIPTIARKLNVANILEGSVRKSGNRLRVTTQLIRARSGEDFWSETYDRELKDVFQVQDEIAGAVVAALKISLLSAPPVVPAPTTNTDAYTLFLRCGEGSQSGAREALETALADCRRAVELDPNFAPAWTRLGDLSRIQFVAFGAEPYETARPRAYQALQRGLALDPKRADVHVALAALHEQMDFDPAAAAAELERASVLEPNNPSLSLTRGYVASVQGRFDEALLNLQRARELDPVNSNVMIQIGNAYYRAGRLTDAAAAFQTLLAQWPSTGTGHYRLGLVRLLQKDAPAALAEMQNEPDTVFHMCGLPMALDALGRRSDADAALAEVEKSSAGVGAAYQIALIYAARHDVDGALGWLDTAYRQRDAGMLWIKADPMLQYMRSDARFKALLVKMHLD